jgi:hypothetical protein
MPRKSTKKCRADSRRVWSDADRIQLLAWLDFSLEQGIDFHETIIGHLRAKTRKEFTQTQIRDKLRGEWQRDRRDGSDRKDLYSEGTAILDKLHQDTRNDIQAVVCELRSFTARYALRSKSSVNPRRDARSSVPDSEGLNALSRVNPLADENTNAAPAYPVSVPLA